MKYEINKWNEYTYPLPNKLLSKRLLLNCLIAFRKDVLSKVNPDYQLSFQLKFKTFFTGANRSISPCNLLKIGDFALLLGELLLILEVRMDEYNQIGVDSLVLGHKISDSKKHKTKIVRKNLSLKKERLPTISIGGDSLPRDLFEWGEVQYLKNKQEAIIYKYKSPGVYYVKIEDNKIKADLRFKNKSVLTFTDELLNPGNLTEFKRTIGNYTYAYCDGEVKYKSLTFRKKYFKPIAPSPFLRKNFITMDLETRLINNVIEPYAVSIYDGKEPQFYYLSDFEDVDQMLTEAIKSLMLRKYNGYTVYLHYMSMFDGVFLLRIISELCEKPKLKFLKFSIINITLYFGKYHIHFRDSYLLLQSSLDKLGPSI